MRYTELILKVSSVCNLNCKYCYVFNKGDFSYKREPAVLEMDLIDVIVDRIVEHCTLHSIERFIVIFHGGEPLLVGKGFYPIFVERLNARGKGIIFDYGIQTNGTLLTQEWIELFLRLGIQIGVSIDGPRIASNQRVYRSNGLPAYDGIMKGVELLKANDVPVNILSVMNADISASEFYAYLKKVGVDYADVLFPDITFEDEVDDRLSIWLIDLFDCWYEDIGSKPMIRYFDILIKLLLGEERGYEVLGRKENRTLCIKTNGNIDLVDSLKICGDRFTNTGYNVRTHTFEELGQNDLFRHYYYSHFDGYLAQCCLECNVLDLCGAGKLPHCYAKNSGFNNPTVYCECVKHLILYVRERIYSDLNAFVSSRKLKS